MAHLSLFRKWRSQRFDEIVGQEHVSRSLKNAVRQGMISSAYLFCGPRGTGKTSVARILAKAINCQHPEDGEPCNACPPCRGITDGRYLDVMEIDAASHTQVEKVREHIINRIDYAPSEGRYKVYIIDEVHRLSASSFDALLKTLEEPPAHAVFILATTEVHRLVGTIQSRCQRFDFKSIPAALIKGHLHQVARDEGIRVEDEALEIIARSSEGSLRDALVLLEQAQAFAGESIDRARVMELLGMTDAGLVSAFSLQLLEGDARGALEFLSRFVEDGGDLIQLNRDCLEHFRRLFLSRVVTGRDALESVTGLGPEQAEACLEQGRRFSLGQILRGVRILLELRREMSDSSLARVFWELAVVRLTRLREDASLEALRQRMEYLEQAVSGLGARPGGEPPDSPAPGREAEALPAPAAVSAAAPGTPAPSPGDPARTWPQFLNALKSDPSLFAFVSVAVPSSSSAGELVLGFPNGYDIHLKKVQDQAGKLEQLWHKVFHQTVRISCRKLSAPAARSTAGAGAGAVDAHREFVDSVFDTFGTAAAVAGVGEEEKK